MFFKLILLLLANMITILASQVITDIMSILISRVNVINCVEHV